MLRISLKCKESQFFIVSVAIIISFGLVKIAFSKK